MTEQTMAAASTQSNKPVPIPISVVAVSLKKGKTTLLNQILQAEHSRRIAVLVNDFGSISIDAELITEVGDGMVSMANGCICCSIRSDLISAVLKTANLPERPEHILIESSGVADPAGIVGSFLEPEIWDTVQLDGVITVVDAEQALRAANHRFERRFGVVEEGLRLTADGRSPPIAVQGEAGWPFTWYWRSQSVWWSAPNRGQRPPLVLCDVESEREIRRALGPGYTSQRVPLRAWWVMEDWKPSLGDVARYVLTRRPWGFVGSTDTMVLRKGEDVEVASAETPVPAPFGELFGTDSARLIGDGWLIEPRGLAVAPDGTLAVADVAGGEIKLDVVGAATEVGVEEGDRNRQRRTIEVEATGLVALGDAAVEVDVVGRLVAHHKTWGHVIEGFLAAGRGTRKVAKAAEEVLVRVAVDTGSDTEVLAVQFDLVVGVAGADNQV